MRLRDFVTLPGSERRARFRARIAGADWETLTTCPERDRDSVRAVANIMLCTWLYQTAIFALMGNRLFGDGRLLTAVHVAVALFLASFILLFDSYAVMRSGWHLTGIQELKRCGVDISGGWLARIKAGFFLTLRFSLAFATAQLTAALFAVLVFAHDISVRIDNDFKQANAAPIAQATQRTDRGIADAQQAAAGLSAQVTRERTELEGLRQRALNLPSDTPELKLARQEVARLGAEKGKADDELVSAEVFASNEAAGVKENPANSGIVGEGVRFRAAETRVSKDQTHEAELAAALDQAQKRLDDRERQLMSANRDAHQQIDAQSAALARTLAAHTKELARAEAAVTELTQGREAAIAAAVAAAPNFRKKDDGFLGQIKALRRIAAADATSGLIILLIEITSFGFEVAGVLAKTISFVPTQYAALLAREAYLDADTIAKEMLRKLSEGEETAAATEKAATGAANDNRQGYGAPPKRPRGRPRKTPAE